MQHFSGFNRYIDKTTSCRQERVVFMDETGHGNSVVSGINTKINWEGGI